MNPSPEVEIDERVSAFLRRDPQHFINGGWVGGARDDRLSVRDPATGNVIAQVLNGAPADVGRAVEAAHAAFADRRWSGMRPADRERILLKLAELIERDGEALAQLETLEQGKSIHISRMLEVGGAIEFTRYAAGLATKLTGQTLDISLPHAPGGGYTAYTRREPVGVVGAISPWNFPLVIAVWKVIPALAAGCTVILKPSEVTPLTAMWLAELAAEAGVPDGAFNLVTGQGAEAGNALVTSPLVSKITFTGSTATGKAIGRTAIDRMARFSLELGGKNPAIVLKDADLDATVAGLSMGAFVNQGQVCAAASRVYVEADLYDRLVAGLEGAVNGLAVGPGIDPQTQVNPLVSATHRDKVCSFIEDARRQGAEILSAASLPESDGYYVAPTLVLNPDDRTRLHRDEVFGPVLAITRVKDADEAIARANDSVYGLGASVWTRDLSAALNTVPRIQAGTVWVNTHIPLDPNLPFGGFKQSGVGREFGPRWLEQFSEEKSVCIAH